MIVQPAQSVEDIHMPDGSVELADIVAVDFSGGTSEVQTIVAVAFASTAQGDYVVISSGLGKKFALWLDKDANGTAPTGAAYVAADYKIKVSIVTGDTNAQVATKVNTALQADSHYSASVFTSDVSTNTVTITHRSNYGDIAAPARHNTGDTGNGSFVVATTVPGVAPTLNSKYFLFSSSSVNYYGWFNVNGQGVDPSVASKTGAAIALTGSETAAQIAAAAALVIDALSGLDSHADGALLYISSTNKANVPNVAAGNSGLSFELIAQGSAAYESADSSPESLSAAPAIISPLT